MRSVNELAAARKAAYDVVENNTDEETVERYFWKALAVEENILAAPFTQADAIDANHQLLHQFGEPDWADEFNRKLARKILTALMPDELGNIAAAA
jgi:hypothetical protein